MKNFEERASWTQSSTVSSLKHFSEQHGMDSDSHTEKQQINEMAAATK